jgi:hypothetical protein
MRRHASYGGSCIGGVAVVSTKAVLDMQAAYMDAEGRFSDPNDEVSISWAMMKYFVKNLVLHSPPVLYYDGHRSH